MGIRKRFKDFKDWCPQPQKIPTNFKTLSTPLLASILIAEVAILLIAPIAYCALLVPKTATIKVVQVDETWLLTNSQIKASWPSLPTAKEVVNGNYSGGYSMVDSSITGSDDVENRTCVTPINAIPNDYQMRTFAYRWASVENFIYLKLNDTTWVEIHPTSTNNPPYSLPSPLYSTYTKENGFLGTDLSVEYYVAIIIVILATAVAGLSYLSHEKRSVKALGE